MGSYIYMEIFKKIYQSLTEIAFPPICVCCGTSTNSEDRFICSFCRSERFENVGDAFDDILPEHIRFVNAMWYFDKGGYLQKILHQLKYHHLRGVGVELGYLLGKNFLHRYSSEQLDELYELKPIVIPVPLHSSKQKKRGYNQARALAEGVSKSTGWEIAPVNAIKRIKKTKTQTGLNLKERSKNLKDAFKINSLEPIENRISMIIDDVFTTGATTFELARTIHEKTGTQFGILTVAQA